jgi:hypothetical protein
VIVLRKTSIVTNERVVEISDVVMQGGSNGGRVRHADNSLGVLSVPLDCDDILTPGVLARDIEVLTSDSEM